MAQRVAFLIGNQKFRPDSDLEPLQGPQNDIAALAPLLRDPERGNFEVHEFLDKPRQEIMHDIAEALDSAALGDFILIYYSGHGMLDGGGRLCIATADTRRGAALMTASSIPARYLSDLVETSNCDQVVLVLDCCFSGAVKGLRGDVGSALQVVEEAHGFSIITATTSMQATREEASSPGGMVMGKFTSALVKGIESGAADQGRKGRILLSDLRHYLGQVVTGSTPRFFDHQASGEPLISLSPATAAPLLDVGVLTDLNAEQWHRRLGAVSALSGVLRHGDAATRAAAKAALQRRLEQERDYSVRAELESALGRDSVITPASSGGGVLISADETGGRGPARTVPALAAALKNPDKATRRSAADALKEIGPDAAEAVPALVAALEDHDEDVRQSAAYALGKIGPAAAEAVPALAAALKGKNIRWGAAYALGKIGPAAARSVPVLTAALKDEEVHIRWGAAAALAEIGPDAAEAVPALIAALRDPDRDVRSRARYALGKINPHAVKGAVLAIAATLKDANKDLRRNVAVVLGEIGPDAAEAVPALTAALKDPDQDVRWSAADALGKIGPDAAEAVPALTAALRDEKILRWRAADALGKIGPDAAEAVPALTVALKDPDQYVRRSAADALGKIGPDAAEAVPALTAALNDAHQYVRQSTAAALERIEDPLERRRRSTP